MFLFATSMILVLVVRLDSKCRATRRAVSLSRRQVCDVGSLSRLIPSHLSRIHIYSRTEPPTKRKPKALQEKQSVPEGSTLLDKFVKRTREDESQGDVVLVLTL